MNNRLKKHIKSVSIGTPEGQPASHELNIGWLVHEESGYKARICIHRKPGNTDVDAKGNKFLRYNVSVQLVNSDNEHDSYVCCFASNDALEAGMFFVSKMETVLNTLFEKGFIPLESDS